MRWLVILASVVAAACGAPPGQTSADAAAIDAPPAPDGRAPPPDAPAGVADAAPGDAGTGPCAGKPNQSPCDDGDRCTRGDRCIGQVCIAGPAVDCSSRHSCELDGSCNPATGLCARVTLEDGSACSDGNVCTADDVCEGGTCRGEPIDDPVTACADGICFTDVAASAGLAPVSGDAGVTMAATAVMVDVNGDGWLDLMAGNEGAPARLYRNNADGTFDDVTAAAGLPETSTDRVSGVLAADYDGDGDEDLYYLLHGANRLFRNAGDGTFTEVAGAAGAVDTRWSMAGAFADYDADGDLDLYVGNYIKDALYPFHVPYRNTLYRNDGGIFADATTSLGVGGAGTTLAVAWTDVDGDGDPDLMVCNDFGAFVEPNRVYENDDGTFTEVSVSLGLDAQIYCMGIAPGDVDRDGDLDYYLTNLGRNELRIQSGAAFTDDTDAAGADVTRDRCFPELLSASWGTGAHDFDNDGWLDLFVANGYIAAEDAIANTHEAGNTLLRNTATGAVFDDISRTAGIDDTAVSRSVAFGDYDQDGDIDVLQVDIQGTPRLWRNDTPSPGNWLHLRLTGNALGAHITAEVDGATLVRELHPHTGYLASSEPAAHFGLGTATTVDRLEIRWPSGEVQVLTDVAANQRLVLSEP